MSMSEQRIGQIILSEQNSGININPTIILKSSDRNFTSSN